MRSKTLTARLKKGESLRTKVRSVRFVMDQPATRYDQAIGLSSNSISSPAYWRSRRVRSAKTAACSACRTNYLSGRVAEASTQNNHPSTILPHKSRARDFAN